MVVLFVMSPFDAACYRLHQAEWLMKYCAVFAPLVVIAPSFDASVYDAIKFRQDFAQPVDTKLTNEKKRDLVAFLRTL
jgi:hypothetical protein